MENRTWPTEAEIRMIENKSSERVRKLNGLPPKEFGIGCVNAIFDDCEEHQKHWTPTVYHNTKFGDNIRKFYSNWESAIRHDYPLKRQLILDLLYAFGKRGDITYKDIEEQFNNRYEN